MTIQVLSKSGPAIHVKLFGSLDTATVERIKDEFAAATETLDQHVFVDLSDVDYVTSLALSMLIAAEQRLRKRGQNLVLIGPQGPVEEILRQTRLTDIMPVAKDLADALKQIKHAS